MSRSAGSVSRGGQIDSSMLRPMLAATGTGPFDDDEWLFEQKWDGYRALGVVDGSEPMLLSRNGNKLNDRFPAVVHALDALRHHAVVDGEIVAYESAGQISFQELQNAASASHRSVSYCLFDILYLDGKDLRALPLRQRKWILRDILFGSDYLRYTDHVVGHGLELYGWAMRAGLEGVMAKRLDSPYLSGQRSPLWLKIKTHQRQEAVIGGFTAPRGSRDDLGALVLGVYDHGSLRAIGHTGTGFTRRELAKLRRRLEPLEQSKSPFVPSPKTNGPVTWVEPELVCEVKFTEWTKDGTMRHPVYLGLRDDKSPREVKRELPVPRKVNKKRRLPETSSKQTAIAVGGHHITLSNQDKILWPEEGITKEDLIFYYRSVARYLLPHVDNRPHSLRRHPDGIQGPEFFQKNVTRPLPEWVKTYAATSQSSGRAIRYLLCQNAATLLYLANLGCIEIHPWLSRIQSSDRPDYCVLDLDPQDVEFEAVVETAKICHEVLTQAGVAAYPKTSGSRGLHIYIPLAARYDYTVSRQFAQLIAEMVHSRLPEVTSLERMPAKRRKRVYIDYLQNGRGKTMAAPYSVRAVPGAQVSTPLRWSEVSVRLRPDKFTIATVPKRLTRTKDLFRPVLGRPANLDRALDRLL